MVSASTVISALIIMLGLTIGIGSRGYADQVDVLVASIDRAPLALHPALTDTLYFWDTGLVGVGCREINPSGPSSDPLALQAALMGHIGDDR